MKNFNFYKIAIIILAIVFFTGCSEEDTEDKLDYGQSFIFTQADGSPIEGALVELFTSKGDKYSGFTPLLTGTTDETGTVHFSDTELNLDGVTFPVDLYLFAEKGYYSNINGPATFLNYSTDYINQNFSNILSLSLIKSFTTPSKWLYKRSVLANEDITIYTSECSKDDYITALVYPYGTAEEGQLIFTFNDGLNECLDFPGAWMYSAFYHFDGVNATMQDGYQLPSGLVGTIGYDVSMGQDISLEIKNDSLYYRGLTPVGEAMNVYSAEF